MTLDLKKTLKKSKLIESEEVFGTYNEMGLQGSWFKMIV